MRSITGTMGTAEVRKPAVELELVDQEAEADHPVPDVDNRIPTCSRAAKRQQLEVLREKRKRKSKRNSSTAPQTLDQGFFLLLRHKTERYTSLSATQFLCSFAIFLLGTGDVTSQSI